MNSRLKHIYKSNDFVESLPEGVGSLGDTIDAPLKCAFMFTETRLKAKGTIRGTGNVPGPPAEKFFNAWWKNGNISRAIFGEPYLSASIFL